MDLALSLTAPASPLARRSAQPERLGRYVLEGELGFGGMGVVHVAYDLVLERRVAIKLPHGDQSDDVRRRLVREARAMARVAHPNVVAVYEVGSAAGREFVAMELAHEATLADWLASAPRSRTAILDAFAAAGRGLAAAHAAGLVHRDFKPSNVLRSHDGRFVVADFGLAVEPQPVTGFARGSSPQLQTQVAGTPEYMAPEQWGGEVTAASDQFSFCVALWEALTGKRPFAAVDPLVLIGEIHERHATLDGPLPRGLRKVIARGLSVDPEARWRSMDILLAQLEKRPRRLAIAGAAAIAVLCVWGLVASRAASQEASQPCELAEPIETAVADPALAGTLDHASARWRELRPAVCAATEHRETRVACLGGVRDRLDAIRRVAGASTDAGDLAGHVISPDVCIAPKPPRLAPLSKVALEALTEPQRFTGAAADHALAAAGDDACARALVLIASMQQDDAPKSVFDDALHAADTCGDDRLIADVQLARAFTRLAARADANSDLARAVDAVARVSQPDLLGELDAARGRLAWARGHRTEAIELYSRALEELEPARIARRLQVVLWRNDALVKESTPADLAFARDVWATWRPLARNGTRIAYDLDYDEVRASLFSGDLAGARAVAERASHHDPQPRPVGAHAIRGIVVDEQGRPVAGATVIAAEHLHGDSDGVDLHAVAHQHPVETTTDRNGAYALDHVADFATVVATHGDRRTTAIVAADAPARDRLVLHPTTTIRGRVEAGARTANIFVIPRAPGASVLFHQLAPIAADGTFVLEHAPIGAVDIGLREETTTTWRLTGIQHLVVPPAGLHDLQLAARVGRPITVSVRNALSGPLAGAFVFVVPGRAAPRTRHELEIALHTDGATHTYAPGPDEELHATLDKAPIGEATVCASGLSGDMSDASLRLRLRDKVFTLDIRCQLLAADASTATIDVLPMKRM